MKSYIIKVKDKEYTVFQDELNIYQDHRIAQLFSDLDIKNIDDIKNLTFSQIISLLSKSNVLIKFLSIILTDVLGNPVPDNIIGSIKNSQLEIIFKDFFSLNPKLKELLMILKNALISTNLTSISKNLKEKSNPNLHSSQNQHSKN